MSDKITWTDPKTWEVKHEQRKRILINSPHFADTTGMPYYDGLLEYPAYHKDNKGICGRIQRMTPDDYIDSCAKVRRTPTTIQEELRGIDEPRIKDYHRRVLLGEKMPVPVIDRRTCSQEGRHRALVAKKLNLKDIPVLVVEDC